MQAKKYDEAAKYYATEKSYFDEQGAKVAPILQALAAGLNAERGPLIVEQVRMLGNVNELPEQVNDWSSIQKVFSDSKRLLEDYDAIELLRSPVYRSSDAQDLNSAIRGLQAKLEVSAVNAFRKFDHSTTRNFFTVYPVPLNQSLIVRGNLDAVLDQLSASHPDEIANFGIRYKALLGEIEVYRLGNAFVERSIARLAKPDLDLYEKVAIVRRANASGLKVNRVKDFSIAYVQILPDSVDASTTYPTIKETATFKHRSMRAADVQNNDSLRHANYLVLIQSLPIDIKRRISQKREEESRVQTGTRTLPNPEYGAAQAKFIQAQSEYNSVQAQNRATPTYGAAAAILRGLSAGISSSLVTDARNALAATSPTITEPIYQPYKFTVTTFDVSKEATIRIWVIDRLQQRVAQFEVPLKEAKSIQVAYNLKDQDPDLYSLRSKYEEERALESFEKAGLTVENSQLANQLLAAAPKFNVGDSESTILASISQAPRIASALPPVTAVALKVTDDPRSESVVVIKNPKGSLGTGFFVTSDLIITNYHVVEGSQVPEIRRRDGQTSIGRVVKTDIGLDLALIRVTSPGSPLQFANSPLATGATVEAIGHPSGMEFSVTRGIISAIRKTRNPLVRGSNEMLVIQTDAAISPGNSGGPLFVGTQVVGVNSQKLVRTGVEGIGFAVHYAEVQRFLQEP